MALTISPAGSGTRHAWLVDAVSFFVGAILGGLTSIMSVIASVGVVTLVFGPRAVVLLSLALGSLVILRELGISVPVPYRSQQVPEWWRWEMSTRAAALAYGSVLGFGFATPFTSASHLATLLAMPHVESVSVMLAAALFFALGKTLVLFLGTGTTTLDDLLPRISKAENRVMARVWLRRGAGAITALIVLLTVVWSDV